MLLGDTQKRKNKDNTDTPDTQAEDCKYKMKMNNPLSKLSLKQLFILLVSIIVLAKLWQLFSSPPSQVLPPEDAKTKVPTWRYANNPQSMTETSLKKLISDIEQGKEFLSERVLEKREYDQIESLKNHELPKVENPYKSTGSVTFKDGKFILGGKPLQILSGAMHYFRVLPEYWEDRMKKMKACGLNTLETYVSWNLHEESPGVFNFDGMLNIRKYIQTAHKFGFYVILRPGPYICSEWDFGGLPAWLLKETSGRVRSNNKGYNEAVSQFFGKLIPQIADLQYMNGGPIIAVQIENEFGSYSSELQHLVFIKELLIDHGIKEMFVTSDGMVNKAETGFHVAPFYDQSLPTVNFMKYPLGKVLFEYVRSISPDFPLMVMEFWSGWFDHWQGKHAFTNTKFFAWDLQEILKQGASVNFYMFHGGTNFGFMAGANWFNDSTYKPDTTSYDYLAPLNEAGDITPKYEVIRALIKKHVLEPQGLLGLPQTPPDTAKASYGTVPIDRFLQLEDLITSVKKIQNTKPVPMEMLDLGNGYGQNFGFILYRAIIGKGEQIKFTSPVPDRTQVMLNGIDIGLFNWLSKFWYITIPQDKVMDHNILDVLVENHGRVNYVHQGFNRFNEERKGISSVVLLDGNPIVDWEIFPLEFKKYDIFKFLQSSKWNIFANWKGPAALYRCDLDIEGTPKDTFLNMKGWSKGVVFINGFNLGRYWNDGPQKTLYVPAPILNSGKNTVVIFELHKAYYSIQFDDVATLA